MYGEWQFWNLDEKSRGIIFTGKILYSYMQIQLKNIVATKFTWHKLIWQHFHLSYCYLLGKTNFQYQVVFNDTKLLVERCKKIPFYSCGKTCVSRKLLTISFQQTKESHTGANLISAYRNFNYQLWLCKKVL